MTRPSQLQEIIRRLGQASAAPIHLRKLLLSPEQEFFAFTAPAEHQGVAAEVYERLGQAAVNIRLIGQYLAKDGVLRVGLSVDVGSGVAADEIFRMATVRGRLSTLEHVEQARILSLYPFNGRPEVLERAFLELRRRRIQILATSSATSVLSCVLIEAQVEDALQHLQQVVILE